MTEITSFDGRSDTRRPLARRHLRLARLMDDARKVRDDHEQGDISLDEAAARLSALAAAGPARKTAS